MAPKWTFNISGQTNLWPISHDGTQHSWKHWLVQPEFRYWFCQRFTGHFIGLHLIGGQYNFSHIGVKGTMLGSNFDNLNSRRYEGWGAGAGFGYGYSWPVSKHWNIEAEIGVGWIYTRFDEYTVGKCCKQLQDNKPHNYVGPTKAAVNVIYLF